METTSLSPDHISASTNIKHRIMKLHSLKAEQEDRIKRDFEELQYAIQPSTIIRNAVQGFKDNVELKQDTVKQTISIGTNFLLDTLVFRNGTGIKKYLLSAGLKKVASYFINRNNDRS